MNEPGHFKRPEVYNPDRFLDPHTGEFVPDEVVVPFGLGKRNCLGQALGEQVGVVLFFTVFEGLQCVCFFVKEFYLFVGGLLSMFEVSQVPGSPLPSYAIEDSYPIGMVRGCPRFDVILTPRVDSS